MPIQTTNIDVAGVAFTYSTFGEIYTIKDGVIVSSSGNDGVDTGTGVGSAVLDNFGSISAAASGVFLKGGPGSGTDFIANEIGASIFGAIGMPDESNFDTIDNSGTLIATKQVGVEFLGVDDTLYNSGSILSVGSGIVFDDGGSNLTIDNSGSLRSSDSGIYSSSTKALTVVNSGVISGASGAIDTSSGSGRLSLTNSGSISGAITLGTGASVVINSGSIIGALSFAGKASVLTNSGKIEGGVTLASGDRLVNTGEIHGGVALGSGDTVNNSWGSIDGAITCGASADVFVFRDSFGHETIDKFLPGSAAGHDTIKFAIDDFAKYSALQSAMKQDGSNVIIRLDAADTITLAGVSLSKLVAADFNFIA